MKFTDLKPFLTEEAYASIRENFAGARGYVPATGTVRKGPLAKGIPRETMKKLGEAFGGKFFHIPVKERKQILGLSPAEKQKIIDAYKGEETLNTLAIKFEMSCRNISVILGGG